MSTTKMRHEIIDGPSLDRLLDSLKYQLLGGDQRIKVEFTVRNVDFADSCGSFPLSGEVYGVLPLAKSGALSLKLASFQGVVDEVRYNHKNRTGDLWFARYTLY